MKTSKKAVVETEFISGTLTMKHQFTMKLCDDRWIVDDLKYGFADSTGWNSDSI